MRVARHSLGGELGLIVRPIPVANPLPYIARHVVQSVPGGEKLRDGRNARVSIRCGVVIRKMSLVGVGHPLAVNAVFIAPHVNFARESTARGKFPLRFRWQTLASPFGIRCGIRVRNLDHRIVSAAFQVAFWTKRMTPVRTRNIGPPLRKVVERYRMSGRRKDDGSWN